MLDLWHLLICMLCDTMTHSSTLMPSAMQDDVVVGCHNGVRLGSDGCSSRPDNWRNAGVCDLTKMGVSWRNVVPFVLEIGGGLPLL